MKIKEYVKQFGKSLEEVRKDYRQEFETYQEEEKDWLCDLEDKLTLITDESARNAISAVIKKLKSESDVFGEQDIDNLSLFVAKINQIVKTADRLNNFKEGTKTEGDTRLSLPSLFNHIKQRSSLAEFDFPLNKNLESFIPHLFSVLKHAQEPNRYPINYVYWKNIIREVLGRSDEYDSLCELYRTFPEQNRHLEFASYLGGIGMALANSMGQTSYDLTEGRRDYKYLRNKVLNIPRFDWVFTASKVDEGSQFKKDLKWFELAERVRKLNDEAATRKFFNSVNHVLTELNLDNSSERIYASLASGQISFTIGSRYVTRIQPKHGKVQLGFYIQADYESQMLELYPNCNASEDSNREEGRVWIDVPAEEVDETDFFDAITELAKISVEGQSKSQFRTMYSHLHNTHIVSAALNEEILDDVFQRYYALGAYWDNVEDHDQTDRFVTNGIWENGWDNKFLDVVNAVQVGDYVVIKAAFVRDKKSVMSIKASGRVTKNFHNGKRLNVDWDDVFELKVVPFGSYRSTIQEITKAEHLNSIWGNDSEVAHKNSKNLLMPDYALNTILYGPPGTGKTYNTVLRAAEIIEGRIIEDYGEAQRIFKENLHDRIEFITFHQNYSYEDFIQGLRPDVENEQELTFQRRDGVFKELAERALENYKKSEKRPSELSKEEQFDKAIEALSDKIQESDEVVRINDATFITDVDDSAFRYTGENWVRHAAGIRMKFSDLKQFYLNDVQDRKQIKQLSGISQLAKQHATYYLLVYQMLLKHLPKQHQASSVPLQSYVIVIDEINRANISRVFGELITLIEPDKRSHGATPLTAKLPSSEAFTVPSNLYIIGTMNTADKSIALLDIALRRRFEFEPMYPKYVIEGAEIYDVDVLKKINEEIVRAKGYDFQIGHSYFMGEKDNLVNRMNKKVIPLLLEYFMNDEEEVKRILRKAELVIEENGWPLRIAGRE